MAPARQRLDTGAQFCSRFGPAVKRGALQTLEAELADGLFEASARTHLDLALQVLA